MKNAFLMILILALGLIGCANKDKKEIVSITIQCADMCKTKTMQMVPFTEKTYEDKDEIKVFQQAIDKAEKMDGMLNYVALFFMTVTFDDGTYQKYVLNVSGEEGSTGLLADTAHSEQGYTIPEDQAQQIWKMINN